MIAPICVVCVNRYESNDYGLVCLAYPEGIPSEIIDNRVDHRKEYEGDNNIVFDPIDSAASKYAAEIFGE